MKSLLSKFALSLIGSILLLIAVPMVTYANASIIQFSMDRTTVTANQNITFTIQTSPQVEFVWAEAAGLAGGIVSATRGTTTANARNWTLTVTPTQSTTITINANTVFQTTNAARIQIPITVTGAATPTPTPTPGQPAPTVPRPTAPIGGIAIHSVTETPSTQQGVTRLTVVTGLEVGDRSVWATLGSPNFFIRGNEVSRDAFSILWTIDIPNTRAANNWNANVGTSFDIRANRTYNVPGATVHRYTLTMAQQFVRPVNPQILNVQVPNRTVAPGANTTFTIRTNSDVEFVWIVDARGNRRDAARTQNTATQRTWTVTFRPEITGIVQVFANATNTTVGASTRNEDITVRAQQANFVGMPTVVWTQGVANQVRVNATTNQHAEQVWVMIGGSPRELQRTNWGATGNRTWEVTIANIFPNNFPMQIRTSEMINSGAGTWSFDNQITLNQPAGTQNTTFQLASNNWLQSLTMSGLDNNNNVTFTATVVAGQNLNQVQIDLGNGQWAFLNPTANPNIFTGTATVNANWWSQNQSVFITGFAPGMTTITVQAWRNW